MKFIFVFDFYFHHINFIFNCWPDSFKKNDPDLPAKPSVQVIERMFALIEVLASREEAISLKEISERTGLHPSTTHRILNDLTIGRFVDRPDPSAGWGVRGAGQSCP